MDSQEMQVMLAVHGHMVTATLRHRGRRLTDVLADPGSGFVELYDAETFRGARLVDQSDDILIPKAQILFVAPVSDRHEAGHRRSSFQTSTRKRVFSTCLMLGDHELRGHIHLQASSCTRTTYESELGEFFPVADAAVTNICGSDQSVRFQAAIVRKSAVSMLHIGSEVVSEETEVVVGSLLDLFLD